MLERGENLQAQFGAITLHFVLQQRARAGAPGPAVGLAHIAMDEVEDRRLGVRAVVDGHPTGQVRHQPQVAISAPRVGRSDDVLGRQRAVGGHPAATRSDVVGQFITGKRAPTGHADQIGGHQGRDGQRGEDGCGIKAAHGCISCNRASTVSVSVIQQ
ncbi:hypothetical protein FQZ97_1096580 [compost metagenome]